MCFTHEIPSAHISFSLEWVWGYTPCFAPTQKRLYMLPWPIHNFFLQSPVLKPTHQHREALNTALSVCRVYLRDLFSGMKQSGSCSNVSLWHRGCGQEWWEDVWTRTSPPWPLDILPLLSHYNGSSMDINSCCGLSRLQGPKLRQAQKFPTVLLLKICSKKGDGFAVL